VLAVLTASVLLALVAPGSAQAASAPCPGRKVRTLSFSTGSVQVYKSNGSVCAVTLQKNPGTRKQMSVSVQARGLRAVRKEGSRTRRIGPVSVYAGHRCVWVRGSVGRGSVSSGWILC
jgi:hypothetical protein